MPKNTENSEEARARESLQDAANGIAESLRHRARGLSKEERQELYALADEMRRLVERMEAAGSKLEYAGRPLQEHVDRAVVDHGALPECNATTQANLTFQMLLYVMRENGLIEESPAQLWERLLGIGPPKGGLRPT